MKLTESRRAYIYRVLIAGGSVAVGYGVVSGEDLAMWLGLAAVVLNVMPSANTSTKAGRVELHTADEWDEIDAAERDAGRHEA